MPLDFGRLFVIFALIRMFMLAKADQIFCFDKYFVDNSDAKTLSVCQTHRTNQLCQLNVDLVASMETNTSNKR